MVRKQDVHSKCAWTELTDASFLSSVAKSSTSSVQTVRELNCRGAGKAICLETLLGVRGIIFYSSTDL